MELSNCTRPTTKGFSHEANRLATPDARVRLHVLVDGADVSDTGFMQAIERIEDGDNDRTINKVREFHQAFGVTDAAAPHPCSAEIRELRVRLIAEELCELCDALGVALSLTSTGGYTNFVARAYAEDAAVDLVETADALGDLDYVVQGANLVFGIPAGAVMDEIHRSNMSKLGDDGKPVLRGDGKIAKGPRYTPPDIAKVLSGQ